jgi:hypothetical protein
LSDEPGHEYYANRNEDETAERLAPALGEPAESVTEFESPSSQTSWRGGHAGESYSDRSSEVGESDREADQYDGEHEW